MQVELRTLWHESMLDFGAALGVPVAFANVPFDKDRLSIYLLVSTLPSTPEVVDVLGGARHVWTLQVSVRVRDATSEIPALELADSLASAFPVLYRFVGADHSFEVQTPPSPAVPISLTGWFSIPVSFRVQTLND